MATFIITFKSGRVQHVETTGFKSSGDSLWVDFVDEDETIVFRVAADMISTVERLQETK